jgi:hypothetical protein
MHFFVLVRHDFVLLATKLTAKVLTDWNLTNLNGIIAPLAAWEVLE